jgi:predicted metal-dependent hydrolase
MTPGPYQQLPLLVGDEQPWRVRVSPRARRLAVRVYGTGKVEVVVPPRVPVRMVEQFVGQHRDWIAGRLASAQQRLQAMQPPQVLRLPAMGCEISVLYRDEPGVSRVRQLGTEQLLVRADLSAPRRWSPLLLKWLAEQAQSHFTTRLHELAAQHDFSFSKVQVRRQRTRWGSCSSSGVISLNLCALFLRPEALRYLMIHELCHTRHMNHSERFWRTVESCQPDYRVLDQELNQAWRDVPPWIFAT